MVSQDGEFHSTGKATTGVVMDNGNSSGTVAKLMVFEGQRSYVDALRLALDITEDLRVVASDVHVTEACRRATELGVDVVVCSNSPSPGYTGLKLVQLLLEESSRLGGTPRREPPIPTVILTEYPTAGLADAARAYSNVSIVSKRSPITDVVRSLRSVVRGQRVFHGVNEDPFGLSKAEIEVLEALVQGGTASSIAADLHLSVHAIRARIRGVLTKSNSTSQLEAVSKGISSGVVAPPSVGLLGGDAYELLAENQSETGL